MHDLGLGLGFGLVTAAILAMSTIALSLQYAVSKLPNFAHGDVMTVGAYAAYVVSRRTDSIFLEALAAMVASGLVAWLINRILIQPFIRAGTERIMIVVLTLAASLLIQNTLLLIFSGAYVAFAIPASAPVQIGPLFLTAVDGWTILVGGGVILVVHLLLRHTTFGKAVRAVADDQSLARVSGIPARRIIQGTWFISGMLAGLAGFVLALTVGAFTPYLGYNFLLVIFAAAVVGGLGRPYGALLGALIIGMAMELSALYIPADYKLVVAFAILILFMLFRPDGLFVRRMGNVEI
jgi:branched-subunit amino acid ABC-type transport system permease component